MTYLKLRRKRYLKRKYKFIFKYKKYKQTFYIFFFLLYIMSLNQIQINIFFKHFFRSIWHFYNIQVRNLILFKLYLKLKNKNMFFLIWLQKPFVFFSVSRRLRVRGTRFNMLFYTKAMNFYLKFWAKYVTYTNWLLFAQLNPYLSILTRSYQNLLKKNWQKYHSIKGGFLSKIIFKTIFITNPLRGPKWNKKTISVF